MLSVSLLSSSIIIYMQNIRHQDYPVSQFNVSLYFQPRAPRGPTSPLRALEAAMTPTLMTTGPCPLCSQAGGGRDVTLGEAQASAETPSDRSDS